MKLKKIYCFIIVVLLNLLLFVNAKAVLQEQELLSNSHFAFAVAELVSYSSECFKTSSLEKEDLLGVLGKTDGSNVDLQVYQP